MSACPPTRAPSSSLAEELVSVILTTYEKPRELELVLAGYHGQDDGNFEVVVADDGSGEETARVVRKAAKKAPYPLVHVWHPDRGFRKPEILNRALCHARGSYVLFSDGDCIPRHDLVSTHRCLARPGRFLSGGYVRLSPRVSASLEVADVHAGRPFDPAWLRSRGQRLGRRRLRLLAHGPLSRGLDRLTPTSPTFNGMNTSVWRRHVLEADGFELDFGWGGLDRELGERLENMGLRGVQVRHRAVVVHLHHHRPYRDPRLVARQKAHRTRVARDGRTRAEQGISALDDSVTERVWMS